MCEVFLPLDEASNDSNTTAAEINYGKVHDDSVVKASAKLLDLMSI